MRRRIQPCVECGDERQIVAFGLCTMCYQRQRRAPDQPPSPGPLPAIRKEHKRTLAGFTKIVGGLADLGASPIEVRFVLEIIKPRLAPISHLVQLPVQDMEKLSDNPENPANP
jgi:hypothetical protein